MKDKDENIEEEVKENEDIEDQTEQGESGDDKNKDKDTKEDVKEFTQKQINKMMTKEKSQGRNSVYKDLGIDLKDKNSIEEIKEFLKSKKTDEEIKNEEQKETELKVIKAENRALIAEAKAEAMMQGVKTQYVDDMVTLALSKLTDDSDLKTIMGEFKTKYPVWFGEFSSEDESNDKNKAGQHGTGSSINTKSKDKSKDKNSMGARLAAQRVKSSGKSSYWGSKK